MCIKYESGTYNKRLSVMHLQMPGVTWGSRKGQLPKDTPSSTHRPALAASATAEAT